MREAQAQREAARWWRRDIHEATRMDLRRWLDRCAAEGLLALRLDPIPAGVRETDNDCALRASDGQRTVERVVNPLEQAWLLKWWPADLRSDDGGTGLPAGRLL